jgi:hypothetical protein
MTITLSPGQEKVIESAIRAGLVRSVDEFIDAAIEALPHPQGGFDAQKARQAGVRIRELRQGVKLQRGAVSFRELADLGHKY